MVLMASLFQRGAAVALTVSAVRFLDPSDFGAFGYGYATAVSLSAFLGDAIAAAILREPDKQLPLAGLREEILPAYLAFAFLGAAFISALVGIVGLIALKDSSEDGILAMMALSFSLVLNASIFAFLCRCGFRKQAAVISLGGSAFILGASALPSGFHAPGAYLWISAMGLLGSLLCHIFYVVYRVLPLSQFVRGGKIAVLRGERSGFLAKTCAAFALGGPVHWICLSILAGADDGLLHVGIFSAFFQWYLVLTFIPSSLVYVTLPLLAEAYSTGGRGRFARRLYSLIGISAVIGSLLVALSLFSQGLVSRYYGIAYGEHWWAFVASIACATVAAMLAFGTQACLAAGRAKENLYATLTYAFFYLALTIVLVGFGGAGALGMFLAILVAGVLQLGVQNYLLLRV